MRAPKDLHVRVHGYVCARSAASDTDCDLDALHAACKPAPSMVQEALATHSVFSGHYIGTRPK